MGKMGRHESHNEIGKACAYSEYNPHQGPEVSFGCEPIQVIDVGENHDDLREEVRLDRGCGYYTSVSTVQNDRTGRCVAYRLYT